jgi:hypothetical protein
VKLKHIAEIRKRLFITNRAMSGWAGLNRRPFGPEPNALPTALQPAAQEMRLRRRLRECAFGAANALLAPTGNTTTVPPRKRTPHRIKKKSGSDGT